MALKLNVFSGSANLPDHKYYYPIDWQAILRIAIAILLGLTISGAIGFTAAELGVPFLIPLVLLIPVGVLLARYPFSAIMIWLVIFPFVVRGTSGFETPIYYAVHRAMIPGMLWFVVMGSWSGAQRRPMIRFGFPELVMILSLLWTIGSILLLGHDPRSIISFYDRLFVPYCMYWLIRLIAPTAEDLRRLLPAALFTLLTQAAIGTLSWFYPKVLPSQWLGEAGDRVVGTFKNPAVFTSTVLFLTLLIFQYGMNSKSKWMRAGAFAILGLGFFCVLISFSRGSWLGGALVLLGLIAVYRGVLLRVAVIGFVLIAVLGGTVLNREVAYAYARLNDAETAQSRLETGAKSLGMIEQRPLFGWGYGNYDAYDTQFRVVFTNSTNSLKESDHTSHNTYLTVMAEQGIPALALYLLPAGWWLLMSLAVVRKLPRSGFWSVTLLALLWLLIGDHFTVSNFMDMIRFNLFGTTIWWMALGLIASVVESAKSFENAPEPEQITHRSDAGKVAGGVSL